MKILGPSLLAQIEKLVEGYSGHERLVCLYDLRENLHLCGSVMGELYQRSDLMEYDRWLERQIAQTTQRLTESKMEKTTAV